MNDTYFDEVVSLLELVLSYAYKYDYSFEMVEKEISRSSFFQLAEKREGVILPYLNENFLISKIFGESIKEDNSITIYKECAWAAESYCHIQRETRLTFEAIFLYIPIKKMFQYFPMYHEMDFFHIVNEFSRLFIKSSTLSLLMENRKLSNHNVSKETGMSYASIFSYKKRRRDIKKMPAESACMLANLFDVRIETILEFYI